MTPKTNIDRKSKSISVALRLLPLLIASSLMNHICAAQEVGHLYPAPTGNGWGYISEQGKLAINGNYHAAGQFSEGLAPVSVGGLYGFIDMRGSIVVAPRFEKADGFSDGLAAVKFNGKWGFIDTHGTFVISPQFSGMPRGFRDGFNLITSFEDRSVSNSSGLGERIIDRYGKTVTTPYSRARFVSYVSYSDGLAWVGVPGAYPISNWTVMDIQQHLLGEAISICNGGVPFIFSEGLAAVPSGDCSGTRLFGYADGLGKMVIRPQFTMASQFYEGLACIEIGDKWGFIDKKGSVVIQPAFDQISEFSSGLASVVIGGKFGFINHKGEWVIKPTFPLPYVSDFVGPLALIIYFRNTMTLVEYIDKTGAVVFPLTPVPAAH